MAFFGKLFRFVCAILRSSPSLIDSAIWREAPRKDPRDCTPRFAAKAAPAAICCFLLFAGMETSRLHRAASLNGAFAFLEIFRVNAAGQQLNFSFNVYKDWVDYGIPASLWSLPLYAIECNG